MISVIAVLVLLLTLTLVKGRAVNQQSGGRPFSMLDEKEMDGILEKEGGPSWSGRPNPVKKDRPVYMTDKNPIVYYGHGIPLVPVEPGPILDPMKIVHNSGLAVRPECCPSPYSTDRGCVCGAIEDIAAAVKSKRRVI
jgi:hypothetical protein